MKALNKLFVMVLAVVMVMSMSVSAFAADDPPAPTTGSIKIENAPAQVAYDAYKIFNANTLGEGDETAVIYTIAADSPWLAVVYDTEEEESKITVPQSVTPNAHANAPASGADVVIFNDLAPGYYMVVPSGGGQDDVASITTVLAGQEVVIQNKNDMPLDKTVDNVKYEGVSVGDEVKFRIKSKVPYVNQDDTYYAFYVNDIMSDGSSLIKTASKSGLIKTIMVFVMKIQILMMKYTMVRKLN